MSRGNAANVTTGKPRVDGGVYIAPLNTVLPTDAKTALTSAFVNAGYVSEEGVTNQPQRTSGEIKEWGGQTVDTPTTGFTDRWKIKFIETNKTVLKLVNGDSNVKETGNKLAVTVNAAELDEYVIVVDMALKGGKLKRVILPRAKVTEVADIVHRGDQAVAYDVTVNAAPDSSGNNHYEYIEPGEATTTES